ncbi:glycosyltransferase [Myroides phaeus]|uniref:glycosyltransferase n=1 Tax=Myroides phaeus TaxID=702745 RepID=UPI0013033E74|nr:glycosyltransferase family 4 protein [Myroides phaeus]
MEKVFQNKRIVVIGQVWPESKSSAAGKRMLQLLACFNQWGMDIYFSSAAKKSNYSDDLSALGVTEFEIWLNDERTDEALKSLNPDIVMFDRFMIEEQFGWRVAEQFPSAMTVLDTEDLHFLRYARQELIKKAVGSLDDYLYSERTKRELASIMRCDLTLLISNYEEELLTQTFGISDKLLLTLPFLEDEITAEEKSNWKTFDNREGFVFIGNFIHEPNWQTVLRLKKEVWPLLRKRLPKVNMHIYGAYPSPKVLQLHNEKERFLVHGRAEDALEVISDARVMLAPITFGAGIKGKFVDAIQVGTPSITTSVGVESMKGELPWCGFICDEVEEMVEKAVLLYSDESVWKDKQNLGESILLTNYDKIQYGELFLKRLVDCYTNLEMHRRSNFLGQVFKHHSAQSSKFFGMWIEAKNKK